MTDFGTINCSRCGKTRWGDNECACPMPVAKTEPSAAPSIFPVDFDLGASSRRAQVAIASPAAIALMDAAARKAGRKEVAGKLPLSRLPWDALREVMRVIVFGAQKYKWGGWRSQPDGEQEYLDAAVRHIADHVLGVAADPESGLSPLSHAATDLLFALAHQVMAKEGNP